MQKSSPKASDVLSILWPCPHIPTNKLQIGLNFLVLLSAALLLVAQGLSSPHAGSALSLGFQWQLSIQIINSRELLQQ